MFCASWDSKSIQPCAKWWRSLERDKLTLVIWLQGWVERCLLIFWMGERWESREERVTSKPAPQSLGARDIRRRTGRDGTFVLGGLSLPLGSISFHTRLFWATGNWDSDTGTVSSTLLILLKAEYTVPEAEVSPLVFWAARMKIGHQRQFQALVYTEAAFEEHIQQSPLSCLSPAAVLFLLFCVSETVLSSMEMQHEPGSTATSLRITHPRHVWGTHVHTLVFASFILICLCYRDLS